MPTTIPSLGKSNEPVPTLIVYAGPNGAGKSTLRDFANEPLDLHIDADAIARTLGIDDTEKTALDAGRRSIHQFHEAVLRGKSLSLETTLTGQTPLRRMSEARSAGYEVQLRYVALRSPELHIARVQERVRKGGHFIPPDTIRRRYERSLDNLPDAIRLANSALIFDNSEDEQTNLMQSDNGQIVYLHSAPPAWFQSRLPQILAAVADHSAAAIPRQ